MRELSEDYGEPDREPSRLGCMIGAALCGLSAMVTVALIAWLFFTLTAKAHEAPAGWQYDAMCCSSIDCYQAPADDVKETPAGYQLSTGEVIPYGDRRIKRSRDEFFHECKPGGIKDGKYSFCLYVPDRGF